jgi:uncharacterized membrane protein YeiB
VTELPTARLPRVSGLDVARAVALLGMFGAHIGDAGGGVGFGGGDDGWRWLVATHGRSSALFTVLAGVSIALMLTRSSADEPVRHTRIRVAVRGAMLIVLGIVVSALGTPIDIILDNLGVMFFMALIAFRWRPWTLVGVGAVFLVFGREAVGLITEHMPLWLYSAPIVGELWSPHYPALVWIGYVLVGMGVGRLAPWRGKALGVLAASGVVLATCAYGLGALMLTANGQEVLWEDTWPPAPEWYAVAAHSYSPVEMLGNTGVALAVIALCCWLARVAPRATWPFAATGSMTLTLYTAHLFVIAIAGAKVVYAPTNLAWVTLCAGSVLFASLWKRANGQGPLERLFTTVSTGAANTDALVRARSHP